MKGKLGFLERIRVSMIRHLHLPELVEMLFYLLVRDGRKEGQGLDKLSPNGWGCRRGSGCCHPIHAFSM
ncbi:hypothetical protein MGWOODY_Smn2117 [hydrothermal vent metagenome]|uniref:Uncharacterized protein n=1 Tax=hydrothermal vent metagenome TaxID=652676 RepID=A0A160TPP0_9ZZZZ